MKPLRVVKDRLVGELRAAKYRLGNEVPHAASKAFRFGPLSRWAHAKRFSKAKAFFGELKAAKTFREYALLLFREPSFLEKFDPLVDAKLSAIAVGYDLTNLEARRNATRIEHMAKGYYYVEGPGIMLANHGFLNKLLARLCTGKGGRAVYAASIGSGELSHEVWFKKDNPNLILHAVEPFKVMRRLGNRTMRITGQKVDHFAEGGFLKPNLPRKAYDVVYSLDAFHWLGEKADQSRALGNMCGLVSPGGHLVISYIPKYKMANAMPPQEIVRIVKSKGFEVALDENLIGSRHVLHFTKS